MVNEVLGRDILLQENDIQFSTNKDFKVTVGVNTLAQAITNRLSTIQGEYVLTELYGSKLNNDLGLPNTNFVKSGIQGHIVEALNQEPRIQEFEIVEITSSYQTITVSLKITPIGNNQPFNMIYPIFLEA